ncbi:TIGR03088 family PEP-CTERM/XrtA system glycosyltransferase [Rhodoferax sp.]|uniref:TIGR03088 family PEP-CTERM/XrtA system glycosyltransferase n=1 Tax=Rhodoferax sp. TaxID=50421 RepID=UPI0034573471
MVHVVYRFDMGGLENGVVNIINNMAVDKYRHVVVALTDITDFRNRIVRDDVMFYALNKLPGHAFWLYPELFRLFRKLRPAIVHTRNLAALEVLVPAWAAGVSVRIHGEHGRDVGDLDGNNRKYQWMRRIYAPFVSHYLALSRDLASYLTEKVHIAHRRVTQVYNGVDTVRFAPWQASGRPIIQGCPFVEASLWIVGTVGRMQTVKDQLMFTHAFLRALELAPELRVYARLALVGEGPLREQCMALMKSAEAEHLAWLPGERNDVADVMRGLDCFVLPSLAEGISNTILEAMACGLPVIATDVGGNADLVLHSITGYIVPAGDVDAIAHSLVKLATSPELALKMGRAGRQRVLEKFSLDAMVGTYQGLYDRLLGIGEGSVPLVPTNK